MVTEATCFSMRGYNLYLCLTYDSPKRTFRRSGVFPVTQWAAVRMCEGPIIRLSRRQTHPHSDLFLKIAACLEGRNIGAVPLEYRSATREVRQNLSSWRPPLPFLPTKSCPSANCVRWACLSSCLFVRRALGVTGDNQNARKIGHDNRSIINFVSSKTCFFNCEKLERYLPFKYVFHWVLHVKCTSPVALSWPA